MFSDVMSNVVLIEELKIEDDVFNSCFYLRPDLIDQAAKVTASSWETAVDIGLYGNSSK